MDVVTRLAKEEAAAEKGAAAAAKADAASGTAAAAADKPDLMSGQAASKTNAAAALKQVHLLEQPVLTWQTLEPTTVSCFILPVSSCCAKDSWDLRYCPLILIVSGCLCTGRLQDLDIMVANCAYTGYCAVNAEDNA